MKKWFFPLSAALLSALFPACTGKSVTAELDTLFAEKFPDDGPGAEVVVVRGGHIVYEHGFGLADLETRAPITDTTMFNICSVSKQFSAVALLKLAEEGKLSLDDSVAKYFPQFKAPFYRDITLRHLLSHTSGIPDARPRTEEQWARYRAENDSRFDCVRDFKLFCDESESCRYLEKLDTLNFPPGTGYEYMNPTFQLVLMIVEQVTGEDFDTWMHDHIFVPAGMPGTVYFEPGRDIPAMAHGYSRGKDGHWQEDDYGECSFFQTKADGGIYTTAKEFIAWDKALFGDIVISAASRAEAHTGHVATDIPDTDYGYGWFIERHPDRPQKIYHTGDNGGFYIFEGRFPEKDLFYLIFANQPHWDRTETVEQVDSIFRRNGWI